MEPDYPSYSLEELYQALSSIDKNAYPERVVKIQQEIQHRSTHSEQRVARQSQRTNILGWRIFLFVFAIISVYWGIDGFLAGEIAGKRVKYTKQDNALMFYFWVLLYEGLGLMLLYLAVFGKGKQITGAD